MNTYLNIDLPAAPFIYTRPSASKINLLIIGLLLIQVAVLVISADFYALLNIIFSLSGVLLVEHLFQYKTLGSLKFSTQAVITGILIGFFMPVKIGFVFVFFLSGFSLFITKILFGGSGTNWINPVAAAVCMAYISGPEIFPPILSGTNLIREYGGFFRVLESNSLLKLKSDSSITSILNSVFLHGAGITLPEGYITMFLNSTSSIPAFRYNIISLLSSIILFSTRAANYVLSAVFLLTYGVLIWIFSQVPVSGAYFAGDILAAFLTGGVLFSAFFVMTESSSAPKTEYGKAICGFLIGIFAFFICGAGASSVGVAFSIVLVNILTPLIEKMEVKIQQRKRKIYE